MAILTIKGHDSLSVSLKMISGSLNIIFIKGGGGGGGGGGDGSGGGGGECGGGGGGGGAGRSGETGLQNLLPART